MTAPRRRKPLTQRERLKFLQEELRHAEGERRYAEEEMRRLRRLVRREARQDDELFFDYDGQLCFKHRCLGQVVEQPLGKGWHVSREGRVTPSIRCERCGAHFVAKFTLNLDYIEYDHQPWFRSRGYGTPKQKERDGWDRQLAF